MENNITKEKVDEICDKQDSCMNCPLRIAKIVEDDPDYDYHTRIICLKHQFNEIMRLLNYLKEIKLSN